MWSTFRPKYKMIYSLKFKKNLFTVYDLFTKEPKTVNETAPMKT